VQTRDQEYAARAYEKAKAAVAAYPDETERSKYGAMCHKLPILIRTAGLAQALAFVDARGDAPPKKLLDDLAAVIGEQTKADLLLKSRTAPLHDYMLLTRSSMAALTWFKRFAQSVLGVQMGDTATGGAGETAQGTAGGEP